MTNTKINQEDGPRVARKINNWPLFLYDWDKVVGEKYTIGCWTPIPDHVDVVKLTPDLPHSHGKIVAADMRIHHQAHAMMGLYATIVHRMTLLAVEGLALEMVEDPMFIVAPVHETGNWVMLVEVRAINHKII